MAIVSEVAREMALDSDVDADTSPLGMGSAETVSTPDTEVTPPESPVQAHRSHLSSERLWAKKKLSQLTQEEKVSRRLSSRRVIRRSVAEICQVSLLTAADFWRTKAITSKGIPAAKTSDGPNGARGGIFVGGTKVRSTPKRPTSSKQMC